MQMIEMEMIENTQAMLVEVNDLPRKCNPVSILAKEFRSVLDRNELILDEHTREKAAQWSGSITAAPWSLPRGVTISEQPWASCSPMTR